MIISISIILVNISIILLARWNYRLSKKVYWLITILEEQDKLNKLSLEAFEHVEKILNDLIPEEKNDR